MPKKKVKKKKKKKIIKKKSKVKFEKKLKSPVSLENIKKNRDLKQLPLIKQSRLSVMPIDSKSWKILNRLGNS